MTVETILGNFHVSWIESENQISHTCLLNKIKANIWTKKWIYNQMKEKKRPLC